jgi:hypothetical protein
MEHYRPQGRVWTKTRGKGCVGRLGRANGCAGQHDHLGVARGHFRGNVDHDLVVFGNGDVHSVVLLVASEGGLLRYNTSSGAMTTTDLMATNEPVYSLARDGRGRLWLLGKELYLLRSGDNRARVIRGLPVSAERSRLLGTTATYPDGVVVGLNRRGILFVETEP